MVAIFLRLVTFAFEGTMESEKTPLACVWTCKIRLRDRMMLPFVSSDRYNVMEAYKRTHLIILTFRNFFRPLKVKHQVHSNPFFKTSKWGKSPSPLMGAQSSKKMASAHVRSHKILTGRRIMFLFASTNTYDPEVVFQRVCTTHFADRTQYRGSQKNHFGKI